MVSDGGVLKCDFHLHSLEDPRDVLEHSASDLVDHGARLGYRVLALTLHGRLYCPDELADYARSRGVLLIPGVELFLQGKEVLLLGADREEVRALKTLDDLRALKRERGAQVLTIAPHPFYGAGQCMGPLLEKYADMIDAVEFCHFYTSWWNPNRRAGEAARHLGKPMLACSDTHQLKWMGHHYCFVDAPQTQEGVFEGIRAGRIRNVSRPLNNHELAEKLVWHFSTHAILKLGRKSGLIRAPAATATPSEDDRAVAENASDLRA